MVAANQAPPGQHPTVDHILFSYYKIRKIKIQVMKKLFSFVILCLYALGTIGGLGYTAYCKAYVITVGVMALVVMAYPVARSYFKFLTD
jgi:hypothetical protein